MFTQDLVAVAGAPVECAVRRDLTLLAANIDTQFLRVGSTLAEAVEMIDRIIRGLDGVVDALSERTAGAAVVDLMDVAERLTGLPAGLEARKERMTGIAGIAAALGQNVLDMRQTLRVLSIYGMNIKIAASGQEQFVQFVDGMTDRLASGSEQVSVVLGKLKDLKSGITSVRQIDRLLAAEAARVVPAVPDQLAADATGLKAHLGGVSDLARRVAAVARSVQGRMAILLGALQVGDSTQQRLAHVISALHMIEAEGCGPGAAAHANGLLAAQVEALTCDFARDTQALVGSFTGLVTDAEALLELIAEQSGTSSGTGERAFLSRLEKSVSDIDLVVVQLKSAQHEARMMASLVADTVADLTDRVHSLGCIRLDVQDIATNTRLLCRRYGAIGRAVSVVATAVDGQGRELGIMTHNVAADIHRLSAAEGALSADDAAASDIGEALDNALSIIRRACQRTQQVAVEGNDEGNQLVQLVRQATANLSEELISTETMERSAVALRERALASTDLTEDDRQVLHVLLPGMAAQYTMAQEREVHARFLLPGMVMAVAASAPDDLDDEEDDGLF